MFKFLKQMFLTLRAFYISTLTFCLIFSSIYSKAQVTNSNNTESIRQLINYSEQAFGSDNRLVSGTIYQDKYYNAKGHPYLLSQNWLKATVYIKGNIFSNVDLKYNLHLDQFILKAIDTDKTIKQLILNYDFIDSIRISNCLFINSVIINNLEPQGYLELIYSGNTTVYLKYSIQFKETLTVDGVKIKFIDTEPLLYLTRHGLLKPIYSRKKLLNFFFTKKKEIRKYLAKNRIKFKEINKSQLISLIQYCDEISSTSKE